MASSLAYAHPSILARNGLKPTSRLLDLAEAEAIRRKQNCGVCGGSMFIEADVTDEFRTGDLDCLSCGRSLATVVITPKKDWVQAGRDDSPTRGRPVLPPLPEKACGHCGKPLTQRQMKLNAAAKFCSLGCAASTRFQA